MKIVIQRVIEANVKIEDKIKSQIQKGLVILLGIGNDDNEEDIEWLTKKVSNLRIFDDENGIMNCSVTDIDGEIMIISQFTLMASTKKGNRPSYIYAAKPDVSIPLYKNFIASLQKLISKPIQTGEFGADMKIALINDGPVTIVMDSKNRF